MTTKAAFFDVDGTLTTERVWRGILEYFRRRGLRRWTHRFFWLYHTPIYLGFKLRIISQSRFRSAWAAHLPWFIRGYTQEEAQTVWDWVAREYLTLFWRADALELIKVHKAAGELVTLVSAGLTPLQEAIATQVGADLAVGTVPELRGGRYTGRIAGLVCIDENKAALTQEAMAAKSLNIDYASSTAYADSLTDLHLLQMVGNPVAFHPDNELRPLAISRGWKIVE
ncbi:MAG: HAD-IB family hydrolase [Anaerolineales bacterium]